MKEITVYELFDLYIDTLEYCGEYTAHLSDELIGYYIFEEFIVGIVSFLYKDSLDRLLDNDLIAEEAYFDSKKLREYVLGIVGTYEWNISILKNSSKWEKIMELSEKIKQHIAIIISPKQQMELYIDTLKSCGKDIKNLPGID
ncbi:MAG: hypothetical protein K2L15_00740, partial [Eubacteriales bacterium]|nr:hypothetical protein [Eubacteriales bacterium]